MASGEAVEASWMVEDVA